MKNEMMLGVLQIIGVSLYCTAIGSIMQNGDKFFGKQDNFLTPIFVLTLFCVSALICLIIVFKKPYELFLDGKRKEALSVILYTAVSLFVILIVLFCLMLILW